MGVFKTISETICRFSEDESGHFALWTAIMGIPLLIGISIALDMENQNRHKKTLEAALDTASLAAVIPDGINDVERIAFAKEVFANNFPEAANLDIDIDVKASREEVEMSAQIQMPTFLGGITGKEKLALGGKAKAVLTKSDTVCVLALDERGHGALEFKDSARFNAPTCSVQVNSRHPRGLISNTSTPPSARNFCSSGGAVGTFYP